MAENRRSSEAAVYAPRSPRHVAGAAVSERGSPQPPPRPCSVVPLLLCETAAAVNGFSEQEALAIMARTRS